MWRMLKMTNYFLTENGLKMELILELEQNTTILQKRIDVIHEIQYPIAIMWL